MTNIIATIVVCVVTNITFMDNEVRAPYADAWVTPGPTPGSVVTPATEKTETTEAVEIKRLSFTWEGETYKATRERVLWSKIKRFVKRETWEEK